MYRLIKELEACHRNMVKAGILTGTESDQPEAPSTPAPPQTPSPVPPAQAPQDSPASSAVPPTPVPQSKPASRPSAPAPGRPNPPGNPNVSAQPSSPSGATAQTPAEPIHYSGTLPYVLESGCLRNTVSADELKAAVRAIGFDPDNIAFQTTAPGKHSLNPVGDIASYALATYDETSKSYKLTPMGRRVQYAANVPDPSKRTSSIPTRPGMFRGELVLFNANLPQDEAWPLYIWRPETQNFIPYSQYIQTGYKNNGTFNFDDEMVFQYDPDGSFRGFHPKDVDRSQPIIKPTGITQDHHRQGGDLTGYDHEIDWQQDPTTGMGEYIDYTDQGRFVRAQAYKDRFQSLTPEMSLARRGQLDSARRAISRYAPGASLDWDKDVGIVAVTADGQTQSLFDLMNRDNEEAWNASVDNTPGQTPQDAMLGLQKAFRSGAIDSENVFATKEENGNVSIYSVVTGKYSTLCPAANGGYYLLADSGNGSGATPFNQWGDLVTWEDANARTPVPDGGKLGAYDRRTGVYPILDAQGQQVGSYDPYINQYTWNPPVETAETALAQASVPTPVREGNSAPQAGETTPVSESVGAATPVREGNSAPQAGETTPVSAPAPPEEPASEQQIGAQTLRSALDDPKFLEYLAYGIPIGAALGLAGYAVGGARTGTLLPYLLGGAGGGALLGGLYGHYYGGNNNGAGITASQAYDTAANLPEDQRMTILNNRLLATGKTGSVPITQDDIWRYS